MLNESARKTINVDKSNLMPLWTFKQEDDALLLLSLYKDSVSFDITGQTVKLGIKRPDNTLVQIEAIEGDNPFTINTNQLDIKLKNNVLAVPGLCECDLELVDVKGKMTTASFFITVNKKVVGETNIAGTNEIPTLEKIKTDFIEDTSVLKADFQADVNNIKAEYDSFKGAQLAADKVTYFQDEVNKTNAHLADIITFVTGDNAMQEHSHINKTTLDKFSVDAEGDLMFDSLPIEDKLTKEQVELLKTEIEASRKDFNGTTHENLNERINADVGYINDRFNDATLLEYEGKYISANESYDGFTKDLKIKGRTIKNLVVNGDFSNGVAGWMGVNSNVVANITNNIFMATGDGSANNIQINQHYNNGFMLPINAPIGTKYYIRAIVKVPSESTYAVLNYRDIGAGATLTVDNIPPTNTFALVGGIVTTTKISVKPFIQILSNYTDSSTQNGKVIAIQQVCAVDLTEMFGAGKEPTKEWCDSNLPFVNGIASVGEGTNKIEVLSVGKNLFNSSKVTKGRLYTTIGDSFKINTVGGGNCSSELTKVKENTFYKISGGLSWVVIYDSNKLVTRLVSKADFTQTKIGEFFIGIYSVTDTVLLNDVQLEEGTVVATIYEPYKEDKISISLAEPLRELPNGVCDEIDIENGKDIRKIAKVILNGSEGWTFVNWALSDVSTFAFTLNAKVDELKINCISPSFNSINRLSHRSFNGEGISCSGSIAITISKNKLTTQDIAGFKAWLQANPVTVYYELSTPIETPLDLPNSLRTYDKKTNIFTQGSVVEPNIYCKIPSDVVSLTDIRHSTVKNKTFANADERIEEIEQDIKNIVTQEAWITPTLTNGWVSYAPPSGDTVAYYKDSLGIVRLKGIVSSGTVGTHMFTLPIRYRPKANKYFICSCTGISVGRVDISAVGTVVVYAYTTWVSLDTISFKAEQ